MDEKKRSRTSHNSTSKPELKKLKQEPEPEPPTIENTIFIQKITPFGIKEIYSKNYINKCMHEACDLLDKNPKKIKPFISE